VAIPITIGNTIINFPDSATDPNWAEPVIQFAQSVEEALASLVGPFDISPRLMNINAYDIVTDQPVTDGVVPLNFPTAVFPAQGVRGAIISYQVYRTSTASTVVENGELNIVYNPASSPAWEIQREFVGDANITFTIDGTGQVKFSTTTIGGVNHVGRLGYQAKAFKQS
jgi:hypothetical protein